MRRTFRELRRAERRGDLGRLARILLPSVGRTLARKFADEEARLVTHVERYEPSGLGHDDLAAELWYCADRWSSTRYRRVVAHLRTRAAGEVTS